MFRNSSLPDKSKERVQLETLQVLEAVSQVAQGNSLLANPHHHGTRQPGKSFKVLADSLGHNPQDVRRHQVVLGLDVLLFQHVGGDEFQLELICALHPLGKDGPFPQDVLQHLGRYLVRNGSCPSPLDEGERIHRHHEGLLLLKEFLLEALAVFHAQILLAELLGVLELQQPEPVVHLEDSQTGLEVGKLHVLPEIILPVDLVKDFGGEDVRRAELQAVGVLVLVGPRKLEPELLLHNVFLLLEKIHTDDDGKDDEARREGIDGNPSPCPPDRGKEIPQGNLVFVVLLPDRLGLGRLHFLLLLNLLVLPFFRHRTPLPIFQADSAAPFLQYIVSGRNKPIFNQNEV
ncbi:hypothetical protein SDC9_110137 [bioreactor metagenome]|uniref:Uncharacterized protein n=1 Tax=bioreactor metagenome TaxID=1076179 RepID=A0A645BD61_9ZZZZ